MQKLYKTFCEPFIKHFVTCIDVSNHHQSQDTQQLHHSQNLPQRYPFLGLGRISQYESPVGTLTFKKLREERDPTSESKKNETREGGRRRAGEQK